jgi:uracil-DNA glycosylase family 4
VPLDQRVPVRDSLARVAGEVSTCAACTLHAGRIQAVPGEGPERARLMVIGEGPGQQEDEAGRPFVGRAGQLLTDMLRAIHLDRHEVFIANVVKCRPPDNRTPLPAEAEACAPFLARQIALVDPEVILVLGRTAAEVLLGPGIRISAVRGVWTALGDRAVMPTYHPAYLLRDPRRKADTWADLKKVAERLGIQV